MVRQSIGTSYRYYVSLGHYIIIIYQCAFQFEKIIWIWQLNSICWRIQLMEILYRTSTRRIRLSVDWRVVSSVWTSQSFRPSMPSNEVCTEPTKFRLISDLDKGIGKFKGSESKEVLWPFSACARWIGSHSVIRCSTYVCMSKDQHVIGCPVWFWELGRVWTEISSDVCTRIVCCKYKIFDSQIYEEKKYIFRTNSHVLLS